MLTYLGDGGTHLLPVGSEVDCRQCRPQLFYPEETHHTQNDLQGGKVPLVFNFNFSSIHIEN